MEWKREIMGMGLEIRQDVRLGLGKETDKNKSQGKSQALGHH